MPDLPATHVHAKSGARRHLLDDSRQTKRHLNTGSKAWRAQRRRVLERDQYVCQHCQRWGNHVDHINNDAHIDVPDEALQTLCRECHSSKTIKETLHGK